MIRAFLHCRPAGLLLLGASLLVGGALPARADVTVTDLEQPTHYASPTPEYFAAAALGDGAAVRKALEEGVCVDAAVPRPVPPELASQFNPHTRVAWLLNEPGTTALMLATANGKSDVAAELIAAKANREARTRSGIRPLDIAAERNDTAMMQLLLGVTPQSDAARMSIVVDLGTQRATLSRRRPADPGHEGFQRQEGEADAARQIRRHPEVHGMAFDAVSQRFHAFLPAAFLLAGGTARGRDSRLPGLARLRAPARGNSRRSSTRSSRAGRSWKIR